ncbi:exodeoxyribonuclease V subunit beta [Rhodoferax sp.]|uniref:exodeoxyribonuclease V subunit beta n=1 Tax=Rhodoferax sp. TaxID=50421 RepID=UPI0027377AAF|nr:exodeoxyribonuclease V subunit beta [Rhodoferax sp.]MDP3191444.1 exodeoxyribonuclease V subunit beta [Rhodoferax sp.]
MSAVQKLDPLTLPLTGLQVIEASAGTGKTWTLAALYVRLVLGHAPGGSNADRGLYPPQILVMTFTDAATAELRGRIRARLAQAARYFHDGEQPGLEVDDFLRALRYEIEPGQWPTCAKRLDVAAQWMDEAAIFTIHGWSSRMLKTHAFDSASLFQQSRVEDSTRLKLTAVQDYWRKWFYPLPADQLGALQAVASDPQDLLDQLGPLWAREDKAPQEATAPELGAWAAERSAQVKGGARRAGDTQQNALPPRLLAPDVIIQAWELWHTQCQDLDKLAHAACTDDVIALLRDTIAAKKLKAYRADWPGKLAEWGQGGAFNQLDKKAQGAANTLLQRFSRQTLLDKGWADAAQHSAFAHIEALSEHLVAEPPVAEQLLAHAAHEVGAAYRTAKARLAQFDFSDLLQNLYRALQAPDGRLAEAIRQQFPVALVDEFQDTDPWQYGALSKIYGTSDGSPNATGLIMIGDPKQAIYSFRGADLATYLSAREQAQAIHTLSGNFRSTAGLVAAVNHVFAHAAKPFGDVPYETVTACNDKVLPLQVAGQTQPAMTVWHLQNARMPRKPVLLRQLAEVFATQMVGLLNAGATRPGAMAVLVKNWVEARAIRAALSNRGVRSVYLSERDSVFATPQATDLWRILRAVAQPRDAQYIRAALATALWGLPWNDLENLFQDEVAWDEISERFHGWQKIWQRQGFLQMLHHLLHEQSIPARLLKQGDAASTQGERQLTNLLHLGDLLQSASLSLQGEGALLRYLEDQLRDPQASGDTAQLRLESDADLVQVITLHKAKGLQYPLVFLPFVANYRPADKAEDEPQRLAEDIRLLYVALTRAEQAVRLGITPTRGDVDGKSPKVKSAVSALLGRQAPNDLAQCLQAWASEHIMVQNAPAPDDSAYTPQAPAKIWKPALTPQRQLRSRWWSASFSALTRDVETANPAPNPGSALDERLGDARIDSALPPSSRAERGDPCQDDQPDLLSPPFNAFPAGSHYGTLLHDLLEWQAQQGWPAAQNNPPAAVAFEWQKLLARKAQGLKLDETECDVLAAWVPAIVNTPLPLTASSRLVLASLKPEQHWAEMAFSLKVSALDSARLDRLIAAHVQIGQPRQAMQPRQLEGMLTGFMDLVLEFEGRYFVLDYKSNKLPGYEPAQLQQAMLAHRYDVQYTLYVLALHRLLKSRLADYDYDRHVGGALYLFLRGIDQSGAGLYLDRPPKALIEALDAAFSARAEPLEAAP